MEAGGWLTFLFLFAAVAALSTLALWWTQNGGYTLYYGDAEAHLNIARRIVDSRTPGYEQIGTVWLPLPHALMLPLVKNDALWRSGLAGAIPSAVCFVATAMFLFGAARRAMGSSAAGVVAALAFAFNPNMLYLQATPMTESVWFACLAGTLYFSVAFGQTQSMWHAAGTGVFLLLGTMARYDGWFIVPFVCLYVLIAGGERRWTALLVTGLIAGVGPLYWLWNNRFYYGDFLEFYRGPYSAKGIQGARKYPGAQDWGQAFLYWREAALLCTGVPVVVLGAIGSVGALLKRAWWPLLLLTLVPAFYVLSIYSSSTPIHVPHLWPNSYYNTRYGMALLPLAAFAAGGAVAFLNGKARVAGAALMIVVSVAPWLAYPRKENWITWKESQVNSDQRRAWTAEAAAYLKANYTAREGILTSFGDQTGIYRTAGIKLRDTLHDGNNPHFLATSMRPDLFLFPKWVVARDGDSATMAVARAEARGPKLICVKTIEVPGAPLVRIYRRER